MNMKINDQAHSKVPYIKFDQNASKKITGLSSIDQQWFKYNKHYNDDINIPKMTLNEYVRYNNQSRLDNYALNYEHNQITYREFFELVDRFVTGFKKMGIKNNDNIAICSLLTPELVISALALNKIGASFNMIDPRIGSKGLKEFIDQANSKYLMTLDVFFDKINSFIKDTKVEKIVHFSLEDYMKRDSANTFDLDFTGQVINGANFYQEHPSNEPGVKYENDKLAAVVYTGGTTGEAKAVMLSNESFVSQAYLYSLADVAMQPKETFLDIIPPFFPYGICFSTYVPLALGAETILIPKFDASIFDRLVMEYKPNHTMGVPQYWKNLMNSPLTRDADLSFLKIAGCGGDKMDEAIELEVNKFLLEHNASSLVMKGYGMTEVASAVVSNTKAVNKLGSVGIPFPGVNTSIFEYETDQEISYLTGQTGEIAICSPTMMLGYQNNEEATNHMIKLHSDGKLWVHTEDCGYIDKFGNLTITDRYKRLIMRRGMTVYPSAIENVIAQSHYVAEVSVVPEYDPTYIEVPVAIIYLNEFGLQDSEKALFDIKNKCLNNLPEYAVPADYRLTYKALPRTRMGKIDHLTVKKTLKLNR